MARIRLFAVFAIAIVAGGTFAFATYRYIQDRPAAVAQMQTRPVVVAAANLDLAAELRREDMKSSTGRPLGARGLLLETAGADRPRPDSAGHPERADPRWRDAAERGGRRSYAGHSEGMRAVSVRVNDVIGVAGYVLPGTRVDVVATISPTDQHPDTTSKVILTNVKVLTAGTKIRARHRGPQAGHGQRGDADRRSAAGGTADARRHRRQDSARPAQSLDKTAPQTPGIRPAALLGYAPPARTAVITGVSRGLRARLDPPPLLK